MEKNNSKCHSDEEECLSQSEEPSNHFKSGDIRDFLGVRSKNENCKESSELPKRTLNSLGGNQPESCENVDTANDSVMKLRSQPVKRKRKTNAVTTKIKRRQNPAIKTPFKKKIQRSSVGLKESITFDQSSDTSRSLSWDYFTPPVSPPVSRSSSRESVNGNRSEKINSSDERETIFIHQLARMLPTATEEQLFPKTYKKLSEMDADETEVKKVHAGTEQSDHISVQTGVENMEVQQVGNEPEAVSLKMVYEMFKQLREDVNSIKCGQVLKADLEEVKKQIVSETKHECLEQVSKGIDLELEKERSKVKKLEKQVKHDQHQIKIISQSLDRCENVIFDLSQKVENLELNNAKKAIIVTGLYTHGRKNQIINQIYDFLDQQLGIGDITVDEFFTMGITNPKPIVIYFQTMEDKRAVMSAKGYLKGLTNKDGNPFYINDYQPAAVQDKKRRERDVAMANDRKEAESKVEIKFTGSAMYLQNEMYVKKVTPPKPSELIQLSPEEVEIILSLPITTGPTVNFKKNVFTPYVAKVTSHEQIRQLYKKLKFIEPSAKHVVCVYRLQGEPEYYNSDYSDDGETGTGRIVLEMLKRQQIENVVVFIARKYGDTKLSTDRHSCYVEAAVGALKQINLRIDLNLESRSRDRKQTPQEGPNDPPVPQPATDQTDLSQEGEGFSEAGSSHQYDGPGRGRKQAVQRRGYVANRSQRRSRGNFRGNTRYNHYYHPRGQRGSHILAPRYQDPYLENRHFNE